MFFNTWHCRLAFHKNPDSIKHMRIFLSDTSLAWGKLDLPLLGISTDWFGKKIDPPLAFSLASDGTNLWFVSTRQTANSILPDATPGKFTPELWKYDVAELFLANPQSGEYLEFNIAANGAWWAAKFSAPRSPSPRQPDFQSQISSYHEDSDASSWVTALSIPLNFLEQEIAFGDRTTGNVTSIQDSPDQTFLSATALPGDEPDFHQPEKFSLLASTKIPPI